MLLNLISQTVKSSTIFSLKEWFEEIVWRTFIFFKIEYKSYDSHDYRMWIIAKLMTNTVYVFYKLPQRLTVSNSRHLPSFSPLQLWFGVSFCCSWCSRRAGSIWNMADTLIGSDIKREERYRIVLWEERGKVEDRRNSLGREVVEIESWSVWCQLIDRNVESDRAFGILGLRKDNSSEAHPDKLRGAQSRSDSKRHQWDGYRHWPHQDKFPSG